MIGEPKVELTPIVEMLKTFCIFLSTVTRWYTYTWYIPVHVLLSLTRAKSQSESNRISLQFFISQL